MLKATHTGTMQANGQDIQCAVLEDGNRVIEARGLSDYFEPQSPVPLDFLWHPELKDCIKQLPEYLLTPIKYEHKGLDFVGYNAELLPMLCGVILDARRESRLPKNKLGMALKAESMVMALAAIGLRTLERGATVYH